jgi:uncharacterized protein (DUF2336 family)
VSAPSANVELDDLVRDADPRRRAKAVRQLAELFVEGAPAFRPQHVAVFDGVLSALAPATESTTRAELAGRIAALTNAPPTLVGQLVRDADVRVAGPLLRASPLIDEPTLVEIARAMGQSHLLAISERATLGAPVTDVLVRRGERDVLRSLAANDGASLSGQSYSRLIKRAGSDGMLAIAVGKRQDISDEMLRELLSGSVDLVRRQLFEAAPSLRKASIAEAMVAISGNNLPVQPPRKHDFAAAQREVVELHRAGRLNKQTLLDYARTRKYEETVAILSAVSALPVGAVDTILTGERRDSVLVLAKALGLEWPTVRALLAFRSPDGRIAPAPDFESARANFERLSPTTAQRVVKFWKERPRE